jgi:hypothetical protein
VALASDPVRSWAVVFNCQHFDLLFVKLPAEVINLLQS